MSSLLMQAAQSAAQADGLAAPPPPNLPPSSSSNSDAKADTPDNTNHSTLQQEQQQRPPPSSHAAGGQGQVSAQGQTQRQVLTTKHPGPPPSSSAGTNSNGNANPNASAAVSSAVGGKNKGPPLRRGKWTSEEEAYANRLIQEFKAGLLPLTDGTTLRTFLSKLLNCDPMRISKKFVGGNCIGKQVFRRRTADLNRLTPEQIQQSRAELSELERRFLERVAQTNRVKSSGVGGGGPPVVGGVPPVVSGPPMARSMNGMNGNGKHHNPSHQHMNSKTHSRANAAAVAAAAHHLQQQQNPMDQFNGMGHPGAGALANRAAVVQGNGRFGGPPSPPWLQPPLGYKQGQGASMSMAGEANSRAAAAGRALLQGFNPGSKRNSSSGSGSATSALGGLTSRESAGLLAMAELQRRASAQNMLSGLDSPSAQNLLAALGGGGSTGSMAQLARSASAARLGLGNGTSNANPSLNNLMLKAGFSRDQLSQLAKDRGLSSASLSNMMDRQNSFDALMSLDFQSLQSIDNLANLIQTGGGANRGNVPESGMKNAAFANGSSSNNLSQAARRLASTSRMESLLQSLSGQRKGAAEQKDQPNATSQAGGTRNAETSASGPSNSNLQSLLRSMSQSGGNNSSSMSSLLGTAGGNAASAVSLANLLRENSQTGLSALRMQDGLNERNSSVEDFLSLVAAGDIPHQDPSLLNVPLMHHQQGGASKAEAAASYLAQQQLLAQATGNSALANALASRSLQNLRNASESSSSLKRKLENLDEANEQGASKR